MDQAGRINLAHEPSFVLGRLTVLPALHQLVRDDGKSEVLQHRVMQVLVALARADGAIVTRDELTMSCWDGRVVGEDAINRILSRLRAVANGIGADSFRIETVTRVGYRLQRDGKAPEEGPTAALAQRPSRRLFLGVGAASLAAAAVAGVFFWRRGEQDEPKAPPAVMALMQQALVELSQDTQEGQNQAIGLYQRVVALAPDYADGWGALANAYALTAKGRPSAESDALRARARSAGQRALALDPQNSFAQVALATELPVRGNWLVTEGALRVALRQHGDNEQLLFALASLLSQVGRNLEALPLVDRMERLMQPPPDVYFFHIRTLWSANRLEEADRVMTEAASIYPTHFAIWFTRFYVLMFSGRARAAIALAENREERPSGIPGSEFDSILSVAHAIDGRAPADVERVMTEQVARAHQGAGYAENTIQYACALGRVDQAYEVAHAYYFSRGFVVPDIRFRPEQGTYTPPRERITTFLFSPVTQPMRADARFDGLMTELGLTEYWRNSGTQPDYRRA